MDLVTLHFLFLVPVNRGVVGDMINHLDKDLVTFPRHQRRPRELLVHGQHAPRVAQLRHVEVIDL